MNKPKYPIDKDTLEALLEEGIHTTKQIAKKLKVSPEIVQYNIRKNGFKFPDRGMSTEKMFDDEQAKEIGRMYLDDKMSTYSIAKKMGAYQSVIYNVLIRQGIPTRDVANDYRMFDLREDYFRQIDTEAKAYWLGLLYADGGLCYRKAERQTSYAVTLSLKEDDCYLIEALRDALYITRDKEVKRGKGKVNKDSSVSSPNCRLAIHSKTLFHDLERQGCTRKKSFTLQFPTPDKVPDHLLRHFIRGYFDGDGCITYCHTNSGKYEQTKGNVNIVGSEAFIKDMASILGRFIETSINVAPFKHSPKCYRLLFSAQRSILVFYRYLYSNASIHMHRKKAKFERFFAEMEIPFECVTTS